MNLSQSRFVWERICTGEELVSSKEINYPATVERKTLIVQEKTERAWGSHRLWAVVSAYNWL
jgi:hypothetical protein